MNDRAGASFMERAVVENYMFRPPYPPAIFERLVDIAPATNAVLDIGCGPGKIAIPLARHFGKVTAVDPSRNMIALGQSLPGGDAPNIDWLEGMADEVAIESPPFDLIVAAASIHWMDNARLFPRLRKVAKPGTVFAVVLGDDAHEPPWRAEWMAFLQRWVRAVSGEEFDPKGKARVWNSYRDYLSLEEPEHFLSEPFKQTVDDFVRCQHSRDTFTALKLGDQISRFDRELSEILWPHSQDGILTYRVQTQLIWGSIEGQSAV